MHGLKWTTNKPSFSDIIQHTFFFLIAVWKDLYTVYTSALLPIASKFGRQESINVTNYVACSTEPPIGSYFRATQWFLLPLFGFCDEWIVSTNYDQIQVKQIVLKDSGG